MNFIEIKITCQANIFAIIGQNFGWKNMQGFLLQKP